MEVESVSAWLQQLALEKYVQVFAENDIDIDALRLLGEADLEKLGVSLGHRKRMLRAIAELTGEIARAPGPTVAGVITGQSEVATASATVPGETGERRHLTVLFCDMVGFTEFASRVDPEVLQRIVNTYEDACEACVTRYGGHVFKRLGDGIIAFFGYPLAHEDEAERAIHVALDIIATLAKLEFAEVGHISVRIGIASGLVVVLSANKDAVGDTMAIASRLQGVAEPDTIVVSERVRRLAPARFEYQDKGEPKLKGIARSIRVWRVKGVRRVESRFEAMRLGPLTPFVGREAEANVLREHWSKVMTGQGQVIRIGGEAGIGKSRLARIIFDETRDDPSVWVMELQCSPFHTQSALYPVANQLRRIVFRDHQESDDAARWAALGSYLNGTSLPVDEALPLLAHLFSVAPPRGEPISPMTAERARLMLRHFLVSLMVDQARAGPGILIIEDLHWADPSTLDLVDLLIDRISDAPILLLLTYRPEFDHPLPPQAHVRSLVLARLRGADALALVRLAFAEQDFGADVLRQVIEKTDGVPLYIEEFTKAVVESREAAVTAARSQIVIPESLHDSLIARLDLLGEAKTIAQLAAMLGREFRRDVLAAIWTGSTASLVAGIARLTQAEFIYPIDDPTQQRYTFKHALIQDAAYESLLKSRRATHHRRIAEVLEAQFAEVVAEQPEVVAHHYAQGKHPERAAHLWLRGGQGSLRRNAHVEAAAHLRSALGAIAELPDTPARALAELDVQVTLGTALVAARGYASSDVEAAWTRAQHLCSIVGNVPQQVPALFGLWMFETVRANHPAGLALSKTIVRLAEAAQSDDILIEAHLAMGISRFFLGELREARSSFDLLLATYDVGKHGGHRFQFGQDPASIALIWLCWIYWLQGDFARADAAITRATQFARSLKHPFTLSYVLAYAGYHQKFCRDPAGVDSTTDELIKLCTEEQIPVFLANGLMLAGWSLCEKGDATGPAALLNALEMFRSTGSRCFLPYWNSFRADVLSARGDHHAAIDLIEDAHAAMEATSERWAEPELHRLRGRVLERSGAARGVIETCYRRAVESARERGMRSWELRAVASLAGSLQSQNCSLEARAELAAALDDLKELSAGRDYRDALGQLQSFPV
jgi:class 3 adenylate cyclase/tetratricopeptide (TPR) repeat protein